ncbi:MAG TPA: glycine zipper 2TM domain-containing protein [Burkholderiales bacterium]|nr:glycine zipper 2TM domain-containing protein [Burkholderiales bacterium]
MSETQSRLNPLLATAAIAVIIFSAVGVGVMTGLIPSSMSKSSEVQAQADTAKTEPVPAPAPRHAPAPAPRRSVAAEAPKRTTHEPTRVASAPPAPAPAPRICANCGSVEAVNVIEQQGEGSGLGAVAGGVAGALLGNQIGGGSGRKIATVAGAAGGAYAGHQIEKRVKSTKRYDVVVRMEDGAVRTFPYETEPAFRAGERVKVVEGRLVAN